MSHAFISYKTDDLQVALWVKDQLAQKGIPCWMAPDSIPGGSSYAQEIPKAIRGCFAFILILSEATQDSRFVPKEIDLAINLDKPILPFMIENFELRDEFSFYLSNINRYPAYQSKEKCVALIADRISEILYGEKSSQTTDEIKEHIRAAKERQNQPEPPAAPTAQIKQVEYIPPPSDYYPPTEYQTPAVPVATAQKTSPKPAKASKAETYGEEYYRSDEHVYDDLMIAHAKEAIPSDKDFTLCLFLAIFGGFFGLHRIYVGKIIPGILMPCTLGGFFCIGWISDIIKILTGRFKDSKNRTVKRK